MPKPCSVHSAFLQQRDKAVMDHFTTRDHCVFWAQGQYPGSSVPPHAVWGPSLQFIWCEEVYPLDFFHSVFIFEASSSKILRFQGHIVMNGHYARPYSWCKDPLSVWSSNTYKRWLHAMEMSIAENEGGISDLLRKACCLFMWQKNTLITFQQ